MGGRALVALASLFSLALLLSACGSSGSSGSSSSAADQEAAQIKAAQCLRQHGVDVPDTPTSGGPPAALQDVPQSTLQAAQQACEKYIQGSAGTISNADQTKFQDAFVAYQSCMRDAGIDIPDPTTGGPGAGGGNIQDLQSQPGFAEANSKCQDKLPTGGPGGLPGGPGGG